MFENGQAAVLLLRFETLKWLVSIRSKQVRISRDVTQLSTNHWINFKTKMLLTSFQSLLSEETPQAHWFIGLWWLWFCGAGWPGKKPKNPASLPPDTFLSSLGVEVAAKGCQERARNTTGESLRECTVFMRQILEMRSHFRITRLTRQLTKSHTVP